MKKGGQLPGQIETIIDTIKPAVEKVKGKAGNLLENAINSNALMVVEKLKASKTIIAKFVEEGNLKIVGANYELNSGLVKIVA